MKLVKTVAELQAIVKETKKAGKKQIRPMLTRFYKRTETGAFQKNGTHFFCFLKTLLLLRKLIKERF